MNDADVEALSQSGVAHIGFGTESASEPVSLEDEQTSPESQ
jgi:hypothetical protein